MWADGASPTTAQASQALKHIVERADNAYRELNAEATILAKPRKDLNWRQSSEAGYLPAGDPFRRILIPQSLFRKTSAYFFVRKHWYPEFLGKQARNSLVRSLKLVVINDALNPANDRLHAAP